MKLGFIFDSPFHILTVFQQPVSDAEAAVTFLAIELAKLGHNITLFSRSTNTNTAFNVRCRNFSIENQTLNLDKTILEPDYNFLIVVNNSPEFIVGLKNALPYKTKFYLWTDFDYKEPLMQGLNNPQIVAEIDAIICVSDWQRTRFVGKFTLPKDKVVVRRHAISPFFEDLFYDGKEFLNTKIKTPALAYVGKPFGALPLLLDVFPDLVNNYPTASLSIFSDLHSDGSDREALDALYQQAIKTKGVNHVGNDPIVQQVARLRSCTLFAYPSVAEETYNMAIMDALAAGLYVVTSNVASLPEYCVEHGKCITEENLRTDTLESFIGQTLSICQSQAHSASTFYDYCYKQSVEMNKKHTWWVRAREWIAMLNAALAK